MVNSSTDIQSIQRQFQEMNLLLVKIADTFSEAGKAGDPTGTREAARIMDSLGVLEKSVFGHMKNQQGQLEELMRVGRVINSSLGLKRVLEEVMDTVIKLMRAERGFLMLRESDGALAVQLGRGIDRSDLDKDDFAFSKTVVRNVTESGKPVLTTNAQNDPRYEAQASVAVYHLLSILSAPLKIKNELLGVIYVDNRARAGVFQENDKELIGAFADQAAVAIDNARLIEELKVTNAELEETNFKLEAANLELKIAYDATLKGWVDALDLRDKETEGHTQRVTVLTENLARAMGVEGDQLLHIRRGALLHDIGKMAIPDGILLKAGELTDDERAIIREHPFIAYKLLNQIEFLRPALDIPYCHHERWDGTGYPRKLKGEEIPFAARIFPVIDVWDALLSDRPYRKGLPPEAVRERIRADSGTHFDPRVVAAFLEMDDLSA